LCCQGDICLRRMAECHWHAFCWLAWTFCDRNDIGYVFCQTFLFLAKEFMIQTIKYVADYFIIYLFNVQTHI